VHNYRYRFNGTGDVTLSDGLDVSGTGTFSEAVTITTESCCFGRCSHDGVEIKTGGLLVFAGGATIPIQVCTAGDVTLSDGDLDVSGTGTFGEAAVTITTGGLAVSAGAATIGVEIQDWWTVGLPWCYNYDTGLMVLHADVTLSDGDLDMSGTGTFR
jgi:hypothetical protein